MLGAGLVDPDAPLLRADDRGVLLGDGCFDTVRVRADGPPDLLDEHLARFGRAAAALGLPYDEAGWRALAALMVEGWTGEGVLRFTLTRGPEGGEPTAYALLTPLGETRLRQRQGIAAVTLAHPATIPDAPWLLRGIKTLSYAVAAAALRHARGHGADDVVFTTPDGTVLEAPTAGVVWLSGGTLCTPPVERLGLLPSVTVARLFGADHGWRTAEVEGTVMDLRAADAVWLVSAGRLAAPVTALDGTPLRTDPAATARVLAATGL